MKAGLKLQLVLPVIWIDVVGLEILRTGNSLSRPLKRVFKLDLTSCKGPALTREVRIARPASTGP